MIKTEIVFVFEQVRNGLYKYEPIGNNTKDQESQLNKFDKRITSSGIRSSYLLGIYIKEKYKNIINRKITSKNLFIYIRELDIHALTAQSQLLGMFPLEEGIMLNKIEIDLAFPQTTIPLEAQKEISILGGLSVPKTIKPFPLRYFSEGEGNERLLSLDDECPPLSKIKVDNSIKTDIKINITQFINQNGKLLISLFNIQNQTLIEDYHYLSKIIDHYINYYKSMEYLNDNENIPIEKLETLYKDCIEFKYNALLDIEATSEISIISMSSSLKKIIKYMEERIRYDQDYDPKSIEIKDDKTPKFVIFSGNELNIFYLEMFLKEAFDVPLRYPEFGSNQFIELHRKDGIDYNKLTENDYHIEYFINGEKLLEISFVDFKQKMNELFWSSRKINNFCKYKSPNNLDHLFYFSLCCSIFIIVVSIARTKYAADKLKNIKNSKL